MELISTPEPHFIPGYTGYCPQYLYRVGDTYGQTTHKLLIDPCVSRIEKLKISNRCTDDYCVERPVFREIDLIKAHESTGDPIYKHPMIPGYEGFIPYLNDKVGRRFSNAATSSIAEFEKYKQQSTFKKHCLRHRLALQEKGVLNRSLAERTLASDYRLPLEAVRPECTGGLRQKIKEIPPPPPIPYSKDSPPHFMNNDDPEKYIKSGYGGHVPFSWPRFGQSNKPLTNSALADFTNNYHFRRSVEWSPIKNVGIGTPQQSKTQRQIYRETSGLIPYYAGHVPGEAFRFGVTFGKGSINAKRWLKEN